MSFHHEKSKQTNVADFFYFKTRVSTFHAFVCIFVKH